MITALQNFISKKGKFVFVLLLFVVVISFVLYLAQGTSVFDLLPDPNREKKEFYGHDLNDPDEMRFLSVENRVASDFGAVVPPLEDSMIDADRKFLDSLQAQMQAAFQANQQDIDRSALQRLFSFMQQWPNLPKNFKVREIARSGMYDPVFSQASIRAKLVMNGQAQLWNYLSDDENHLGINDSFNRFVRELDPSMTTDDNRSRALQFVGDRQGVKTRFVESTLFSHFRAHQVDRIFSEGGFTLDKEGELDLFSGQFAWKADLLSLSASDLNTSSPGLFEISFSGQPAENDSVRILFGSIERNFIFVSKPSDNNSSDIEVQLGANPSGSLNKFILALRKEKFDFTINSVDSTKVIITPVLDRLPAKLPSFNSSSAMIEVSNLLDDTLKSFHEERRTDTIFMEPAKTFATMITFPTKNFLSMPPPPEEMRLKSYFDLNRDEFQPVPTAPAPTLSPEGEKGPTGDNESNQSVSSEKLDIISSEAKDLNNTEDKVVLFEDVKEEIRLRIIEEDRLDAEREAKDLAREASLDFLDQINSLRDVLKSRYSSFSQKRNSPELTSLIKESGGEERRISFASKEMGVQAAILGLERRESERRNNSEPLEEVSRLNESLFFTRSSRTVRNGYAIFVLDRKIKEAPAVYENVSFADLYREYSSKLRSDAFVEWTESTFNLLQNDGADQNVLSRGNYISLNGKSLAAVESSFTSRNQKIRSRLSKLEDEREEISKAERDSNATALQKTRKAKLDQLIDAIRLEQDTEDQNRALSLQLVEECSDLEVGKGWSEVERTEDVSTFVRLQEVYSLKPKQSKKEDISTRVNELEFARSEKDRDLVLGDLLSKEFIEE